MKPFFGFGTSAQIAAFHAAATTAEHQIIEAGVSAGDHVLATLKASPIAQPVIDAIETIKSGKNADGSDMTGLQKAEHVALDDAMPLILKFAADGGVTLVNTAKDTAVSLVTSLYNDLMSGAVKATNTLAGATAAG